jgi:predicted DNA-binding transcriptional regulator AlpA
MKTIKLYSPKQVAAMLGFNKRTLNNWRYRKRGPKYLKIGNTIRYEEKDIQDFIKQLRRKQ